MSENSPRPIQLNIRSRGDLYNNTVGKVAAEANTAKYKVKSFIYTIFFIIYFGRGQYS